MKRLPSRRNLITIMVLIVLLSPVVNMLVPESNTTTSFSLESVTDIGDKIEEISSNWQNHPKPLERVVDFQDGWDEKIISFNSMQYRDAALKILPEASIDIVYKFIPAIAVSEITLSDYDLEGIRSVTPDMKFMSMSSSAQLVELGDEISNGNTLAETGNMIGTNYLKSTYGLSGEGVQIAVLDTGVNSSLPAFHGKVSNLVVSDLADRGNLDQDGHGSHVTGIISSNGIYNLNGEMVQTDSEGVAPGADILSIRVLDEQGIGDNSWIIEGMETAIDQGVDIISLSLSTVIYEGENDPMQLIVNEAISRGIMVIAAAGNTGPVASGIGIPGALDGVIAVGATFPLSKTDWEIWTFSGVGPSINSSGPDLVAPGANILSVNAADGTVAELSGTSMATPHISGGIALLMEAFPNATFVQIREALLASSQVVFNSNGFLEQVEAQGRGQVRFDIAYQILQDSVIDNPETHRHMSLFPNFVQDRNYIYHHRLIGEMKELPFYIYSSRSMNITGVVNITATSGLDFHFAENLTILPGKNVVNITLEVTSQNIEIVRGEMYFVETETNETLPNTIIKYSTLTRYAEANILFDTSHDGDTQGAYFGNHGPNGQFSQMVKSLAFNGQNINSTQNMTIDDAMLSNYDMLIIANPDREYLQSEIEAIRSFVRDDGKSLFVIVSGGLLTAEGEPTYPEFNRDGLNSILQDSGISIPADSNTPLSTKFCNFDATSYDQRTEQCLTPATFGTTQSVFSSKLNYPHFGPQLTLDSTTADTTALAFADGQIVAASSEYSSNGRVMVFSSQLPFDNIGILYDYLGPHTAVGNEGILNTAVDWLLEPNQAKMITEVNGKTGTEFQVDMYDRILIKATPVDKDGGLVNNLGDVVSFDVQEEAIRIDFTNINGEYYLEFPDGISASTSFNFFYYLAPVGSIPTDSHFTLTIQLRNFENQDMYRRVSLMLLLIFAISWVAWIRNEGGRELWLVRQSQTDE